MENGVLELERLLEKLLRSGVRGGEKVGGVGAHGADHGVLIPGVGVFFDDCGESASDAALRRRFVVPNAFVDPDRAEQTTATL
jgi:hypothetical protein